MINSETAIKNLLTIQKILQEISVNFFLCEGTLLGAIRENKFLDHDQDIDIGIFHENEETTNKIIDCIKKEFKILYTWTSTDLGITEISLKTNPKIDVFFYFEENNFNYNLCYGKKNNKEWLAKKYVYKKFKLKEFLFLDNMFYIPDNPEEYLSAKYGDWKTRCEQWDWFNSPKNSINYNTKVYCNKRGHV
jgi:hypothetical protein